DPKDACRQIYGDSVVAHAPVPGSSLVCDTPSGELAQACGAMPWNIGREGEPAAP
ncbi:MAG: hypothetical protein JKY37_07250, partial [Nannocystaceae bacterium]|nr:hypothetical protein [Nannocystaceae bacterium]